MAEKFENKVCLSEVSGGDPPRGKFIKDEDADPRDDLPCTCNGEGGKGIPACKSIRNDSCPRHCGRYESLDEYESDVKE